MYIDSETALVVGYRLLTGPHRRVFYGYVRCFPAFARRLR